jgi:hypothetical protein
MVEHTLRDLLAFGLHYAQRYHKPPKDREDWRLSRETFGQYLVAGNEVIAAAIQQLEPVEAAETNDKMVSSAEESQRRWKAPATLEQLLAFGREFLRVVAEGGSPPAFHLVAQYVDTLNELMQAELAQRKRAAGRKGEGMGEQVARFLANGWTLDEACQIVAGITHKSPEAVKDAYDRAQKKNKKTQK